VKNWFQAFAFKWVNLCRYTWAKILAKMSLSPAPVDLATGRPLFLGSIVGAATYDAAGAITSRVVTHRVPESLHGRRYWLSAIEPCFECAK
jgi:hypothetical protein